MTEIQTRKSYNGALKSDRVLAVARLVGGHKQSKSWQQYQAAFETAMRIINEPAPQYQGLAETPAKVEAAIRAQATALSGHRDLVAAAEAAARYADQSLAVEAERALLEVTGLVQDAFDLACGEFLSNMDAPEVLNGYEDDNALAMFQARQRAANEMANLMSYRVQLGTAAGEFNTSNDFGVWTVLEAPDDEADGAKLQTYFDVIRSVPEVMSLPPVKRFRIFTDRDMQLSMASLHTIEDRQAKWLTMRNVAQSSALLTNLGELQRRESLGLPTQMQDF